MNLRKEQILFLAVLALGVWIWKGREDVRLVTNVAPKPLAWDGLPPAPVVLADAEGASVAPVKDLFREPTEAEPLPPRALDFPPLAPLPIVAPPLEPGQDATAFDQLRFAAGPSVPHRFEEATPEDGEGEEAVDDGQLDQDPEGAGSLPVEVLEQRYDRLYLQGQRAPFFGNIVNQNKIALATAPVLQEDVRFEIVSRQTGRVTGTSTFEPEQIARLVLADNLENRIALRKLELADAQESIPRRIEFIQDLLVEARTQPWAYQEAEAQARKIAELSSPGAELGYRWLARVLRAQGDLEREWELYQALPETLAESSFRYRAQGDLEMRLDLHADAEEHLRRAVEIAPNDARSLARLADAVLELGRAQDALPFAERALRNANQVVEPEDRFDVLRVVVEVQLALGRLDEAREALDRMSGIGNDVERSFLTGAVAYARGELDPGATAFERAAADATDLDAVLGLGLVRLRRGEWDAARNDLLRVVDGAPLLRARALAALGLLYERTGHPAEAMAALEHAERVDPTDSYTLYLLGRQQRLEGRYDEAIDTLKRALAERDDLIEALAEIARALIQKSQETPDEAADLQVRAARYIERVVELDQRRASFLPYLEAQGYVLARIGDVNLARTAFRAGVERGSDFSELGLALLDYRQKRVTDARDRLASIANDPARAAETREFARETLLLIDEHASKEQVRDGFERDQLGGLWSTEGALEPQIVDGKLLFRGNTGRINEESLARRTLRAGDFLRAEVTMQILGDAVTTQFAGLRLNRDGGRQDFEIFLAMQRQRAELYVKDGRPRDDEVDEPVPIASLDSIDFREPQRLTVEVRPLEDGNREALALYWNDQLVAERDSLRQLNQRASWTMNVDLVVRGKPVHVAFDDFRLVRRKETR